MIEGYKNTSIGEIPKNWEVRKLKDYLGYIQPTQYITNEINNVGETPVLTANKAFVLGFNDEKENVFEDLPVIIFDDFTTDSKFVDFPFKVRSSALKILVPTAEEADIKYIYETLKSINYQCSEHKRYWISEYQYLSIPIPPLPEQQKIAEILSTVDAKIEAIDQRIAETQQLKKGLMQQLLTKGIGHTKFKDSPLGVIPVSWEVKELGQLSSIKGRIGYRGYTKADLVTEGEGALTIGAKHIDKNSQLNFSEPVFINWEKYEESPEIKVSLGDLLMVQRGTLGKIALVKELPFPATINPSMVLIKELKCNDSYLFYYLCSNNIQDIIYQISTATAVPMISQKQINSFKIALPNLKEQQKISDILSSVDDKLQIQQDKKTEYQELKKGLMQQLLTGKVRVKI